MSESSIHSHWENLDFNNLMDNEIWEQTETEGELAFELDSGAFTTSGTAVAFRRAFQFALAAGAFTTSGSGITFNLAKWERLAYYSDVFIFRAIAGDAAGKEGLIQINTFDKNVKIYADSGWRTLASW